MEQEDHDAIETFRSLPADLQSKINNLIEQSVAHLRESPQKIDHSSFSYNHFNQILPGSIEVLKIFNNTLESNKNASSLLSFVNNEQEFQSLQKEEKYKEQQKETEKNNGNISHFNKELKESEINDELNENFTDNILNRPISQFIQPSKSFSSEKYSKDILYTILNEGEQGQFVHNNNNDNHNNENKDNNNNNDNNNKLSQQDIIQQYHEKLLRTAMMQYFGPDFQRRQHLKRIMRNVDQILGFFRRSQSFQGKRWLSLIRRIEVIITGVSNNVIDDAVNIDRENEYSSSSSSFIPLSLNNNIKHINNDLYSSQNTNQDFHESIQKKRKEIRSNIRLLQRQVHSMRQKRRKLEDMLRRGVVYGVAAEIVRKRCSELKDHIRNKDEEIRKERRRVSQNRSSFLKNQKESINRKNTKNKFYPSQDKYDEKDQRISPSTWWRWSHGCLSSTAWPKGIPIASTALSRSLKSILTASDPLEFHDDALPQHPISIKMDHTSSTNYIDSYSSISWRRLSVWRSLAYNIPENASERRNILRGYAHALAAVSKRPRIAYEVFRTVDEVPTLSRSQMIKEDEVKDKTSQQKRSAQKKSRKQMDARLIIRFTKLWKGAPGKLGAAVSRIVMHAIRRTRRMIKRYSGFLDTDYEVLRSSREVYNTKHTLKILIREVAYKLFATKNKNNNIPSLYKVRTAVRLACITELQSSNLYNIQRLVNSSQVASFLFRRAIIFALSVVLGRPWVKIKAYDYDNNNNIDKNERIMPLPSDATDAQHLAKRIQRWVRQISGEKPKHISSLHVRWFIRWLLLRMIKHQQT